MPRQALVKYPECFASYMKLRVYSFMNTSFWVMRGYTFWVAKVNARYTREADLLGDNTVHGWDKAHSTDFKPFIE